MQLAGGPFTMSQRWVRSSVSAQSGTLQSSAENDAGHLLSAVRVLPTAWALPIHESGLSGMTTTVVWPASFRAVMRGAR